MERYINVDLFKKNTNPVWYQPDDNSEYCGVYNKKDIEDMIDAQPTADVTDVKHGHWADDDTCSVCGVLGEYTKDIYHEDYYFNYSPYCSHCGAKMDEEV